MSGNLGAGTRNFTVNVPTDLYVEIHKLAEQSGVRLSEYLRTILADAAARQVFVRKNPADLQAFYRAVENDLPRPEVRLEPFLMPAGKIVQMQSQSQSARVAETPPVYGQRKKR